MRTRTVGVEVRGTRAATHCTDRAQRMCGSDRRVWLRCSGVRGGVCGVRGPGLGPGLGGVAARSPVIDGPRSRRSVKIKARVPTMRPISRSSTRNSTTDRTPREMVMGLLNSNASGCGASSVSVPDVKGGAATSTTGSATSATSAPSLACLPPPLPPFFRWRTPVFFCILLT